MPERPVPGETDDQVTNPRASSGGPGAARAPRPSTRPVMPAPGPHPGAASGPDGSGDAPAGERRRPGGDPGAADLFGPDGGDPVDAPTSATPVTEPAPSDPTEAVPMAAPRPAPRPAAPATVQVPAEQARPAEQPGQPGLAGPAAPAGPARPVGQAPVPTRPTEHTRQMGGTQAQPDLSGYGGDHTVAARAATPADAGPGAPGGVAPGGGLPGGAPTSRVPVGAAPGAGAGSGDVPSSEARTQVLPRVTPAGQDPAGPGTRHLPGPAPAGPDGPGGDGPGGDDGSGGSGGGDGGGSGRARRRGLLVAGAVVAVLVVAYLADLFVSSGSVPRGVTVAGQDIGGLSRAAAIERLHSAIEPRTTQPVQVTAGPVRSQIDPRASGLSVDYEGTLDRAGSQPLNPFTRVASFFGTRDVPVVNKADTRALRTAVEQLGPIVDQDPKDGNVRFDGVTPIPVAPEPGQHLDVDAAVGTLQQQWAVGGPVALPLQIVQPSTTPEDVQKAIDQVARPAVSAPLTVTGEGANATVAPQDIAKVLTFKADPQAAVKLTPQINVGGLTDVVQPQLASTEKPAVDATLDLSATPARVVPSVDGRGIDYKASFANLVPVLTGTGPRQVPAVYAPKPPKLTTQAIQSLGSATEIGSFTTGGFAADSGVNIHRAADTLDGQIVAPGETFSLNGATDPRDASTGYVDAGIIEDGHPARGIGGGVSQLATTLYNASYFAGMTDVEHKEHSYYISRYPAAREATVFEGLIDVKFRNDGPTPVLIRTKWTPSNITVTFLGQKRVDVTSTPGPRTDYTDPQVVTIPAGQACHSSNGAPGFTTTDTKTTRNLQTGETTSKTRTVKYNPSPIVKCDG